MFWDMNNVPREIVAFVRYQVQSEFESHLIDFSNKTNAELDGLISVLKGLNTQIIQLGDQFTQTQTQLAHTEALFKQTASRLEQCEDLLRAHNIELPKV